MKTSPSLLPEPRPHFELQMFETARRRAERLREQAIDDAVRSAYRAPGALLHRVRSALRRAFGRGAAGKATAASG